MNFSFLLLVSGNFLVFRKKFPRFFMLPLGWTDMINVSDLCFDFPSGSNVPC